MRKIRLFFGASVLSIFLLGGISPCLADNFTGTWYEYIGPFGSISKPSNSQIELTITQGKPAYRIDVKIRTFNGSSSAQINERLAVVQKDYPGDYSLNADGKTLTNGTKTITFIAKGETFQVANSGGWLLTDAMKAEEQKQGVKTVDSTAEEDLLEVTELSFFKRGKLGSSAVGPDQLDATRKALNTISAALTIWHSDKSTRPKSLDELVPNYVDKIPAEEITGSNKVVKKFDGKGGWVYNPKTGEILLNLKGKDPNGEAYKAYGSESNQ